MCKGVKDMKIPKNVKNIIEPFAGNCDLLKFINNENNNYIIECFDIDSKKENVIKQNTLEQPPNYDNKFIITNPPFLARNKISDKKIFDKYGVNDLYKCFIKEILTNKCLGGIIILPLNFFCSIRKMDIELRKNFLQIYNIILLNVFEEKVFQDTTYTICSLQFELKTNTETEINIIFYPSKNELKTFFNENNNFTIGGEIYTLKTENKYKITRATLKNKTLLNTNILVKCIDDNKENKINLSYVSNENLYIDETPNLSSRTYCTLIIEPKISKNKQKKLVNKFNNFLEKKRLHYNSLFLTNYRESKDISRKRISFDLVYLIVGYLLENINSNL
jgi:hypothetical protein